MQEKYSIVKHILNFKQPAGTSRGTYTTRKVWYIQIPPLRGLGGGLGELLGECAPLPALSCDDLPDDQYESILLEALKRYEDTGVIDYNYLRPYPSILFGLEMAARYKETGSYVLWDTPFSRGEEGIPINGLIWMGNRKQMLEQIDRKLEAGFRCIKLKIGAIAFEEELSLLQHIRKHFTATDIELRVDANGAFTPGDAIDKLKRLAELDLHSIEQPIPAGHWQEMARLAETTPLPIALDEELIGINELEKKRRLLDTIRPQYIILKPSLHGGFSGCEEWILEAGKRDIPWWVTSALESNIGLNAIAQWCATKHNPLPQGLGTGSLFTNNIDMPLSVRKDCLWFTPTPTITIEGISYTANEIEKIPVSSPAMAELTCFLQEWFNEKSYITVQTSGSTGTPKKIKAGKKEMINSAGMTCNYLGLKQGNTALLCMSLKYIGAKMMVVRALVAGLNLIVRDASGHPLENVSTPIDFAAMVPLQVYNSLQTEEEKEKLKQIRNLIIGGGAIRKTLENDIRNFPHAVYSTYGMTETLSHIALRKLNGPDASILYTPFKGIELSVTEEGTLIINAPQLSPLPLFTNDLADIKPDGKFCITGRKDNIINTGGIKIPVEKLEEMFYPYISCPFAVTSLPDNKFGEAITLLIASSQSSIPPISFPDKIPSAYLPKHTFLVKEIPITANGKTDRMECRKQAQKLFEN